MKTILTLLAALALVACADTTAAPPPVAPAEQATRLSFAAVEACQSYDLVTLPARVEVNPAHRAALNPPFPAQVRESYVREGQRIAPGAVLALLHIPELSGSLELQAKLEARVLALTERRKLEADKRAFGVGTGEAVAVAEAELADAQVALAASRTKLQAAERSGLRQVEGLFRWQALRGGLVSELALSVGTALDPSQPALWVWDPDQLEVVVKLPEQYLTDLADSAVLVWQPSGSSEARNYELALSRRDPRVDPATRALELYFALPPQSKSADFMLGRSGRAVLRVPAPAEVWRVPASAVCQIEGEDGVFVSTAAGEPRWQPVQVVQRSAAHITVRSSQLTPAAQVVVRGVFLLKSARLLEQEG